MFAARLVCSDMDCAEAFEARVGTLGELDTLACDCGCALQALAWPDATAEPSIALVLVGLG